MNRTKLFLHNFISTAIYQVTVMVSGFLIPRVILTTYGSEINGLFSSIMQFITYFTIAEAGISGAAVYALYKPLSNKDYDAVNGIVAAARRLYWQSGWIFAGAVACLAGIYPFFICPQGLTSVMVSLLVVVLGAKGVLEFFLLAKYRALLTADQKTYVISWSSTVYIVLNTLIVVMLARKNMNIILVYSIAMFALFSRTLILIAYSKAKYSYINYSVPENTAALSKRWDALFLQILQAIQQGAPIILATVLVPLKVISVYTIFNMILSGINNVLGIFTSGLSAAFGDILARKEEQTLKRAYDEFECAYYSMITFVFAVSFIMIMPFVRLYTASITDANYNDKLLGFLFVLNGFLYCLKTPQGMLVISAGLYRETRYQNLAQGLIIVIGGAMTAFIPQETRIYGIVISMCLSNLYRDIDLALFIPRHITDLSASKSVWRIIRMSATLYLACRIASAVTTESQDYMAWVINALKSSVCVGAVILVEIMIYERRAAQGISRRVRKMVAHDHALSS